MPARHQPIHGGRGFRSAKRTPPGPCKNANPPTWPFFRQPCLDEFRAANRPDEQNFIWREIFPRQNCYRHSCLG